MGNKTKQVKITIKLGPDTLAGEGETTLLALQSIKKPAKIVSRGTVTIEFDGQKTERYFRPQQLHRLFYSSPALQTVQAKMLTNGLAGVKFA